MLIHNGKLIDKDKEPSAWEMFKQPFKTFITNCKSVALQDFFEEVLEEQETKAAMKQATMEFCIYYEKMEIVYDIAFNKRKNFLLQDLDNFKKAQLAQMNDRVIGLGMEMQNAKNELLEHNLKLCKPTKHYDLMRIG